MLAAAAGAADAATRPLKRKQPEPPLAAELCFIAPATEQRGRNGDTEKKLEGMLSSSHTFQQWLSIHLTASSFAHPLPSSAGAPPLSPPTSSDSAAARKIRAVLGELEVRHSLEHFHLKIHNSFDHEQRRPLAGCRLTVIAGSGRDGGPHAASSCMSCDLSCSLAVGVGVQLSDDVTSADSLLSESAHTRVWIDAKGRPMLVFTPVRHVERLSELDDCELHDLLHCIHAALNTRGLHRFNCAIVNHGNFRNHAHLHVKLRFSPHVFDGAVSKWTLEERQKIDRIRAFAAKAEKQRRQDGVQGNVEE
jgi:hypothetical protein